MKSWSNEESVQRTKMATEMMINKPVRMVMGGGPPISVQPSALHRHAELSAHAIQGLLPVPAWELPACAAVAVSCLSCACLGLAGQADLGLAARAGRALASRATGVAGLGMASRAAGAARPSRDGLASRAAGVGRPGEPAGANGCSGGRHLRRSADSPSSLPGGSPSMLPAMGAARALASRDAGAALSCRRPRPHVPPAMASRPTGAALPCRDGLASRDAGAGRPGEPTGANGCPGGRHPRCPADSPSSPPGGSPSMGAAAI
uniref:Uncharacterized protein n=1 Tax=Oryza nivara TaxID=4536 RepID=A0A0E0IHA2_ORYNI